jgi:hypothetical protein
MYRIIVIIKQILKYEFPIDAAFAEMTSTANIFDFMGSAKWM